MMIFVRYSLTRVIHELTGLKLSRLLHTTKGGP